MWKVDKWLHLFVVGSVLLDIYEGEVQSWSIHFAPLVWKAVNFANWNIGLGNNDSDASTCCPGRQEERYTEQDACGSAIVWGDNRLQYFLGQWLSYYIIYIHNNDNNNNSNNNRYVYLYITNYIYIHNTYLHTPTHIVYSYILVPTHQ
jgi:hypothetical protein